MTDSELDEMVGKTLARRPGISSQARPQLRCRCWKNWSAWCVSLATKVFR